MNDSVEREGTIVAIKSPNRVLVRFCQQSACAACAARSTCHAEESSERLVEVTVASTTLYSEGDLVHLRLPKKGAWNAILLAFVVPMLLCVLALYAAHILGWKEGWGVALLAGILSIYYFIIYLFKSKLSSNLPISVVKRPMIHVAE